jgi:hypothetical protein
MWIQIKATLIVWATWVVASFLLDNLKAVLARRKRMKILRRNMAEMEYSGPDSMRRRPEQYKDS